MRLDANMQSAGPLMKKFLLAGALIILPTIVFFGALRFFPQATQTATATPVEASLGDVAPLLTIVTDTATIAATGDFAKAQLRITDFETAWDEAQPVMRAAAPDKWDAVDTAADTAIKSLRVAAPDAAAVKTALAGLLASFGSTDMAGTAAGVTMISGIAVTSANGHALPCEVMLKDVNAALTASTKPADVLASAKAFQVKATERCNADDDANADAFSAQALALLGN